ncbi:hypothetical protein FKP32DRAFT_1594518 [Trametes sanguinea]|nr:hypothetical protein FKP32DRAFT_1594518 [Trametes sanguinea]
MFARLTRQQSQTQSSGALLSAPSTPSKHKSKSPRSPLPPALGAEPVLGAEPSPQDEDQTTLLTPALRSSRISDHAGKTNIPALKDDVQALAGRVDRLTKTLSVDRDFVKNALERLSTSVDDLRKAVTVESPEGPSPVVQQIYRLMQALEREEDARDREVSDVAERTSLLEDQLSEVTQSVTKISRELACLLASMSKTPANVPAMPGSVSPLPEPSLPDTTAAVPSTSRPRGARQRRAPRAPSVDGRTAKRPRTETTRPDGPSKTTPSTVVVRLGAMNWSPEPDILRKQVMATAQHVWKTLPGVFDTVRNVSCDGRDRRYALLEFPHRFVAETFVEAWRMVDHPRTLRNVRADIQ